ncbi:MAG: RAD55 family ATPase [Candidatus Thermoplasmatota archaeon]|nr:RAD55 family ATPase [Candidatus Thermoplasmatota archaeon]
MELVLLASSGKRSSRGRKKKPAVIVEEEADDELVEWDAVEWSEIETPSDESVFPEGRTEAILKEMLKKAWEDGEITDDEMALLKTFRENLGMDEDRFKAILEETMPEEVDVPEAEELPDEDLSWEDEVPCPSDGGERGCEVLVKDEDAGSALPMDENLDRSGPSMITLTSTIRDGVNPLSTSFDLEKPVSDQRTRCPTCRSLVRFDPSSGKDRCPVCGNRISRSECSGEVRALIDRARQSQKSGDLLGAKGILQDVIVKEPGNKEAQFFLQRVNHALSSKGLGGTRPTTLDPRELSSFGTGVPRLDQLIRGGIPVGSQVLLKGPAFCGKEVLIEHMVSSALRSGFPLIYVSSNRAMKDVLKGILRRTPDFKNFNRDGRVRMYDLFTRQEGQQVLRDGHRLFNLEHEGDFKKFHEDLLFVQEELVKEFGGGLMVINSLSPILNHIPEISVQKLIQTILARSKGYRFTNVFDIASGIHSESTVNSIEYLMDGIIDLREIDNRRSLRIRGLSQGVLTRDWVDYSYSERGIDLFGSFSEERIV